MIRWEIVSSDVVGFVLHVARLVTKPTLTRTGQAESSQDADSRGSNSGISRNLVFYRLLMITVLWYVPIWSLRCSRFDFENVLMSPGLHRWLATVMLMSMHLLMPALIGRTPRAVDIMNRFEMTRIWWQIEQLSREGGTGWNKNCKEFEQNGLISQN